MKVSLESIELKNDYQNSNLFYLAVMKPGRESCEISTFCTNLSWILDENKAFLTTELVSALSNFNPYKSLSISMMHWNHSIESSEDDDEIPLCVFSTSAMSGDTMGAMQRCKEGDPHFHAVAHYAVLHSAA